MDCEVQVIPPGSVRADQENGALWERLDRQAVKASLELLRLDVEVTQDVMYTDPDLEEVPGVKQPARSIGASEGASPGGLGLWRAEEPARQGAGEPGGLPPGD